MVPAMIGLPIPEAAEVLGIREGTLVHWLRIGAPVAVRGRRGRGHATRVDPTAVLAWREAQGATEKGPPLDDLRAAIPALVADCIVQAFAAASPATQSGAEHRRLRAALDHAGRLTVTALLEQLGTKSI